MYTLQMKCLQLKKKNKACYFPRVVLQKKANSAVKGFKCNTLSLYVSSLKMHLFVIMLLSEIMGHDYLPV